MYISDLYIDGLGSGQFIDLPIANGGKIRWFIFHKLVILANSTMDDISHHYSDYLDANFAVTGTRSCDVIEGHQNHFCQ